MRQAVDNAAPGATNTTDLLVGFKTTLGLTAQGTLPDFTIYRIHLKVAIAMHETAAAANNGASVAVYVDSFNQVALPAFVNPYDQQWLVFDEAYISEAKMNGGVTPFNVVHTYDVRARRRVMNITDTLIIQIDAIGAAVLDSYSYVLSCLVRTS